MDLSYVEVEHPPLLDREHLRRPEDMACAARGPDAIHALAYAGALEIEQSMMKHVRPWMSLLKKSVKTGLFGFGTPVVRWEQLFDRLFFERLWPVGLSREEILILRTAKRMADYIETPRIYRGEFPQASEHDILKAMKRFAELFESRVLDPVYSDAVKIARRYGREIEKVCPQVLGHECQGKKARLLFWGAISRGWSLKCIDWKYYDRTKTLWPYLEHWMDNYAER